MPLNLDQIDWKTVKKSFSFADFSDLEIFFLRISGKSFKNIAIIKKKKLKTVQSTFYRTRLKLMHHFNILRNIFPYINWGAGGARERNNEPIYCQRCGDFIQAYNEDVEQRTGVNQEKIAFSQKLRVVNKNR